MELVKKNILSIVCGVVVLASIVFFFLGVKPKYFDLKQKMQSTPSKIAQAVQLANQPRQLPALDGNPKQLKYFPAADITKEVKDWVSKLKGEALKLKQEAVRINIQGPFEGKSAGGRLLLVSNVLPKPPTGDSQGPRYQFRSEYAAVLKPSGKPTSMANLPDAVLRGVEPPTDDEIRIEMNKMWDTDFKTQIIVDIDANGQKIARNRREVVLEYLKATENFPEDYRKKRAQNFKVYLERNALAMLESVADPKAPAPSLEDIWYAQMSLWIQQDVCNAINTLNTSKPDYRNIPTDPVKHLISLEITQSPAMYAVKGGVQQAAPAAPVAAPPPPEAAPAGDASAAGATGPSGLDITVKDYSLSPTGRVCNRLYDVVQFQIDVVVDAQMVKPFIQQLQFKQFTNVLEIDVQGVDLDAALAEGFEYGKKPVVELKLKCEALFLRDWTAWVPSWVPSDIRKMINVPPSQQFMQGPMPSEVMTRLGIGKPAAPAPTNPDQTAAVPQ